MFFLFSFVFCVSVSVKLSRTSSVSFSVASVTPDFVGSQDFMNEQQNQKIKEIPVFLTVFLKVVGVTPFFVYKPEKTLALENFIDNLENLKSQKKKFAQLFNDLSKINNKIEYDEINKKINDEFKKFIESFVKNVEEEIWIDLNNFQQSIIGTFFYVESDEKKIKTVAHFSHIIATSSRDNWETRMQSLKEYASIYSLFPVGSEIWKSIKNMGLATNNEDEAIINFILTDPTNFEQFSRLALTTESFDMVMKKADDEDKKFEIKSFNEFLEKLKIVINKGEVSRGNSVERVADQSPKNEDQTPKKGSLSRSVSFLNPKSASVLKEAVHSEQPVLARKKGLNLFRWAVIRVIIINRFNCSLFIGQKDYSIEIIQSQTFAELKVIIDLFITSVKSIKEEANLIAFLEFFLKTFRQVLFDNCLIITNVKTELNKLMAKFNAQDAICFILKYCNYADKKNSKIIIVEQYFLNLVDTTYEITGFALSLVLNFFVHVETKSMEDDAKILTVFDVSKSCLNSEERKKWGKGEKGENWNKKFWKKLVKYLCIISGFHFIYSQSDFFQKHFGYESKAFCFSNAFVEPSGNEGSFSVFDYMQHCADQNYKIQSRGQIYDILKRMNGLSSDGKKKAEQILVKLLKSGDVSNERLFPFFKSSAMHLK